MPQVNPSLYAQHALATTCGDRRRPSFVLHDTRPPYRILSALLLTEDIHWTDSHGRPRKGNAGDMLAWTGNVANPANSTFCSIPLSDVAADYQLAAPAGTLIAGPRAADYIVQAQARYSRGHRVKNTMIAGSVFCAGALICGKLLFQGVKLTAKLAGKVMDFGDSAHKTFFGSNSK
jgi:hypothetical protein